MHLQVSCLGIVENLINVVDQTVRSRPIQGGPVDRSPLAQEPGAPAPKTQECLRELGPDGMLVVGTRSGL
jgi:hypothetical protein